MVVISMLKLPKRKTAAFKDAGVNINITGMGTVENLAEVDTLGHQTLNMELEARAPEETADANFFVNI